MLEGDFKRPLDLRALPTLRVLQGYCVEGLKFGMEGLGDLKESCVGSWVMGHPGIWVTWALCYPPNISGVLAFCKTPKARHY